MPVYSKQWKFQASSKARICIIYSCTVAFQWLSSSVVIGTRIQIDLLSANCSKQLPRVDSITHYDDQPCLNLEIFSDCVHKRSLPQILNPLISAKTRHCGSLASKIAFLESAVSHYHVIAQLKPMSCALMFAQIAKKTFTLTVYNLWPSSMCKTICTFILRFDGFCSHHVSWILISS